MKIYFIHHSKKRSCFGKTKRLIVLLKHTNALYVSMAVFVTLILALYEVSLKSCNFKERRYSKFPFLPPIKDTVFLLQ